MKTYEDKKDELRDKAIRIQHYIMNEHLSWWDIADLLDDLEKEARKYGLLKEFRENGIL